MKKRILIDGDILAYRASSSVQRDIDWGDGLWTCHAFLSDAKEQFYNLSDDIINREVFGDDEYEIIFAFSDSHLNLPVINNIDCKYENPLSCMNSST